MSNPKFYVDATGKLLGKFHNGAEPSDPQAVEVPTLPEPRNRRWDFDTGDWGPVEVDPVEARRAEYKAKGWEEPFDLIDDILERGIDTVKAERSAIKARHPKAKGVK